MAIDYPRLKVIIQQKVASGLIDLNSSMKLLLDAIGIEFGGRHKLYDGTTPATTVRGGAERRRKVSSSLRGYGRTPPAKAEARLRAQDGGNPFDIDGTDNAAGAVNDFNGSSAERQERPAGSL